MVANIGEQYWMIVTNSEHPGKHVANGSERCSEQSRTSEL